MGTKSLALLMLLLLISGRITSISVVFSQEKVRVEVVAQNLAVPWSLAFAPDSRLFFTERPGRIRAVENGLLRTAPVAELSVAAIGEGGLLGLAVDPDFRSNGYLYVYYTFREGEALWNRVVRFTEQGGRIVDERIIVDHIPGSGIHDGGRVKFGPDGKLYITTGDAAQSQMSQDIKSLAGKVLRVNPDGTIPSDNPFPNSLVYTLGHRNPQGIDWHPITKKAFISEHGPIGHDEVNLLEPGKNYGWPIVVGQSNDPRFVNPVIETGTDTWAPAGLAFYSADLLKGWEGRVFLAALRGRHLRMLVLSSDLKTVESHTAIFSEAYGRLRDVVQGPDGFLYFSTSNRDGRGSPAADDDRILRVKPVLAVSDDEVFYSARTNRFQVALFIGVVVLLSSGVLAVVLKRKSS